MNLALVLDPRARREFDEASDWYEAQQPGLGATFTRRINEVLDRVKNNPELYAMMEHDIRAAPVRQFPFRIYYRIAEETVIVLAIIHTSRDPQEWQKRW